MKKHLSRTWRTGGREKNGYLRGSTFWFQANGAIKQGPYGENGLSVFQKQQGSQHGQSKRWQQSEKWLIC